MDEQIVIYDKYWRDRDDVETRQAVERLLDARGITRSAVTLERLFRPERLVVTITDVSARVPLRHHDVVDEIDTDRTRRGARDTGGKPREISFSA